VRATQIFEVFAADAPGALALGVFGAAGFLLL